MSKSQHKIYDQIGNQNIFRRSAKKVFKNHSINLSFLKFLLCSTLSYYILNDTQTLCIFYTVE